MVGRDRWARLERQVAGSAVPPTTRRHIAHQAEGSPRNTPKTQKAPSAGGARRPRRAVRRAQFSRTLENGETTRRDGGFHHGPGTLTKISQEGAEVAEEPYSSWVNSAPSAASCGKSSVRLWLCVARFICSGPAGWLLRSLEFPRFHNSCRTSSLLASLTRT